MKQISSYLFYIVEENGKIIYISLKEPSFPYVLKENALLNECALQLEEYFLGHLKKFSFPYEIKGSDFAKTVYQKAMEIEYGQTSTYSELASLINHPKAYRAIGNALHHNPLLLLVPCHRIMSKKGMGGFAYGLKVKEELLKIENASFK